MDLTQSGNRIHFIVAIAISFLFALCIALVLPSTSNATPGVDDYPSQFKNAAKDSTIDSWGFYNRECTSFVAWRLNNDNGFSFTNFYKGTGHFGNGYNWGTEAKKFGFKVDMNPTYGSVAWTDDSAGHVAWVLDVKGNNVIIEEYNLHNNGKYAQRTLSKYEFDGFIHFKDLDKPPALPSGSDDSIDDGIYSFGASGKTSALITAGSNASDGSQGITMHSDNSTSSQYFKFERQSDDTFKITSVTSGNALGVTGGSTSIGATVRLSKWTGGNSQRWYVVSSGNGAHWLVNKASHWRMSLKDGNTSDGASVIQWKWNSSAGQKFVLESVGNVWNRLSGSSRYDTMSSIITEAFDSSDVAILASGDEFPDALAASSLMGEYDAPLLITPKDNLCSQAVSQLERLGVQKVVIVGGESAISTEVEDQLADMGITTERLSGSNRQETSLSIYQEVAVIDSEGDSTVHDTVIVASGSGFADALSISPYAYNSETPILLTDCDTMALTEEQV
ncbi:MAG: cell wall-binding repeat-containing protein, partial [Coriobacteriales bacterium]